MNPLNVAVFCVVYGALFYHVTAQSTRRCPSNMIQLMNGIACSTDAMCQGMATGFFCYQGYCCSNSNQVQSGYGSSCTFDSQCIYPNMHCSSNVCYCLPGYDYDGSTCSLQSDSPITQPGGYYSSCSYDNDCNFVASRCLRSRCQCQAGYIFDGIGCLRDPDYNTGLSCPPGQLLIDGLCLRPKGKGEYCVTDDECKLEAGLRCINSKCQDLRQIDQPLPPLLPEPCPVVPDVPYPVEPPASASYVRSAKVTICGGGTCGTNQVSINGQCYQTAQPGGTCQFNSQCIDLHALRPMYCANGICQWVNNGNPTCKTPSAVTERINGVIKNCLYQDCSTGYRCEYNANFNNGQYICCSTGGTGNGANPIGQPKFYLGSQMPLQCRAVNACTFVDYPNCVYSQRYGYQVCCSTRYCQ
uniref:CC domain-containing protein n=1 Tax=Panagrellus redivivus TaxID=6233 RepID=A0A7E4VPN0_PANRE